jgi:ATP-dependent helicase HepA
MEQMFAAYGVESEEHSAGSLILRPTSRMLLESFPGLPAEGMTCTYQRTIALLHEERQFLSWEHPLVLGAMEMLLDSGQGNSAATAVRHPSLKPGSLLLEALLVLECPAPGRLQAGRFLPPTLLRLLLDQNLRECSPEFSRQHLETARVPLQRAAARKIITPLRAKIQTMLERATELANTQCPPLIAAALGAMGESYQREIERLTALQKVNRNVREEEIEALREQASELEAHISAARPRLDALQLIVAL